MTAPANTIYDQMREAVQRVAEARAVSDLANATLKRLRATFEDAHAAEIVAVVESKRAVAEAEATARALAEAHFTVTGEKKPVPGIEVREKKEYDIDETAGLAWAREKGMCLVPEALDVKAVKKLATVQPLPFVTVRVEPQVTLASDLTAALAATPE